MGNCFLGGTHQRTYESTLICKFFTFLGAAKLVLALNGILVVFKWPQNLRNIIYSDDSRGRTFCMNVTALFVIIWKGDKVVFY